MAQKPFTVPLRQTTVDDYVRFMVRMIALTLRARKNNLPELRADVHFSTKVATATDTLSECIKQPSQSNELPEAVHQLIWALLSSQLVGSGTNIVLLALIFFNVRSSGQLNNPSDITPIISAIQWCFRATGFQETISQLSKALGVSDEDTYDPTE